MAVSDSEIEPWNSMASVSAFMRYSWVSVDKQTKLPSTGLFRTGSGGWVLAGQENPNPKERYSLLLDKALLQRRTQLSDVFVFGADSRKELLLGGLLTVAKKVFPGHTEV